MKRVWVEFSGGIKNQFSYNYTPSFLAKSAFFYIQSMGHFYCDENYFTRRKGYRSFLLIYTLNGKGYAIFRDKKYELTKGQVLLMNCYDYQEYYTDKENLWEIKWIHFNGASSEEYYNIIYRNYGPVIDMRGNISILDGINKIIHLLSTGDIQFEVKASNIIVNMLTNILLAIPNRHDIPKQKENNIQIDRVIGFIEENYNRNISLEDMAAFACSSKYHFSRNFKKITGYSPYEYLIKYRINKAKSILETTNDAIKEVSLNVGFESTSSFIQTFKRLEGLTPLKYRNYWSG
mgnify:CR=1 FL=1